MLVQILVVEDEVDLRSGLCDLLRLEGYNAAGLGSIAEYIEWTAEHRYQVLLVDRTLPDGDGLEVLRRHHSLGDAPAIIMSGKGAAEDRIAGLEADADYYLVKPIDVSELVALIRRFDRRRQKPEEEIYQLDGQRWKLYMPDKGVVPLTRSEMNLMSCFVEQPGMTVNREEIIRSLGGRPDVYDERRLEVLIRRFRKKVTEAGYADFPLATVYGQGYVFNEPLEMV
jgi:DNA-binding response OmpR family regulator